MTLKEFWNSIKTKGADYDGMYGEQCVDLINAYCDKVFGIKGACYGVTYAYEVFSKISNTKLANWTKIPYRAGTKAEYGDIIVWKKERNGYAGHIAIVKSCTDKTVTVYEQNYDGLGKTRKPTLADGGIREHTYDFTNVYGFIKPPKSLKSKVGTAPAKPKCVCKYVNDDATIIKATNTYKTNKFDISIGNVQKDERVRVLKKGENIAIIQYGIDENTYACGCIDNSCLKLD